MLRSSSISEFTKLPPGDRIDHVLLRSLKMRRTLYFAVVFHISLIDLDNFHLFVVGIDLGGDHVEPLDPRLRTAKYIMSTITLTRNRLDVHWTRKPRKVFEERDQKLVVNIGHGRT
jgi:hypothetical protein